MKSSNLTPPNLIKHCETQFLKKKNNCDLKDIGFKGIGKKLEVADFQKKVSENDWVTDRKASDLQFAERALGHNT